MADCQWLQRLHTYGLLRPSFRPPESVLALRGYWRQRQMQVRYAASHVQHIQKALEQMNVKLTEVAADIIGLTGTRILEAILQGQRDATQLARLRDPACQKTEQEYAQALQGTWRPEHLFALKQAYALYRFHHQQITECDERVAEEFARLPNRAADKPFQPRPRRAQTQEQRGALRCRAALIQGSGRGPDADRWHRGQHRPSDFGGDWRRCQPFSDGEAFCQLATVKSAVGGEQSHSLALQACELAKDDGILRWRFRLVSWRRTTASFAGASGL